MRLRLNDKCYILSKWAYSERYYGMHGRIQILWRRRQTSHQMLPRTFSAPAPAQLATILLGFFNFDCDEYTILDNALTLLRIYKSIISNKCAS